jgi:hypothetical protein
VKYNQNAGAVASEILQLENKLEEKVTNWFVYHDNIIYRFLFLLE